MFNPNSNEREDLKEWSSLEWASSWNSAAHSMDGSTPQPALSEVDLNDVSVSQENEGGATVPSYSTAVNAFQQFFTGTTASGRSAAGDPHLVNQSHFDTGKLALTFIVHFRKINKGGS